MRKHPCIMVVFNNIKSPVLKNQIDTISHTTKDYSRSNYFLQYCINVHTQEKNLASKAHSYNGSSLCQITGYLSIKTA